MSKKDRFAKREKLRRDAEARERARRDQEEAKRRKAEKPKALPGTLSP